MLAEIKQNFNPEILQEALKQHGLATVPEPKDLEGFESYVFACQKKDNPTPLILKLYHQSHRSKVQIEAELNWVDFLAKKGLNVPELICSSQGNRIETLPNNFFAVVTKRLTGYQMSKKLFMPEYIDELGGLYGRLHRASYEYSLIKASKNIQRPHWNESAIVNFTDYLPSDQWAEINICQELYQSIQGFSKSEKTYGLIHGDLHDGNFLLSQDLKTQKHRKKSHELFQIFDFDDCQHHWFSNDIAVGLYYLMHRLCDPFQTELKTDFAIDYMRRIVRNYHMFFELPAELMDQIPFFLRYRDAFLYGLSYKIGAEEAFDQEDLERLKRLKTRILNQDSGCDWPTVKKALKTEQ